MRIHYLSLELTTAGSHRCGAVVQGKCCLHLDFWPYFRLRIALTSSGQYASKIIISQRKIEEVNNEVNTLITHCSRTNQVAKYICFEILQIYFKTCIFLYSTLTVDNTIWIFHYFVIFCFAFTRWRFILCITTPSMITFWDYIRFLPYIFSSSDFEEIFFTLEIYCREKIFKLVNIMCRLCIM